MVRWSEITGSLPEKLWGEKKEEPQRDVLKEAIADAKAVREIALANAKLALNQAFTLHISGSMGNVGTQGFSGSMGAVGMSFPPPTLPPNTPHETVQVKYVPLNEEFVKKIDEILAVVVAFDKSGEARTEVVEIKTRYEKTGILTKQDMQILNGFWKIFVFERRFHPDRETTLGKLKKFLGGLNG